MSITANTMINRAARLIRAISPDQSLTAQEAADGLYALNSMLDAWGTERLMVYQVQQATHSWTASAASKTIGSGGDFSAARPIRIEANGNFFRDSDSLDYPLVVLPRENYDQIAQKSASGSVPEYLFYDDNFPTRTLYAYPVPNQALTLYLNTWKALQAFTALSATILLPPGYQAAIEYNLASWIAPEYGAAAVDAAKALEKQASILKGAIKSLNHPSMVSTVDPALIGSGGRRSRIESDT